MASQVRTDREPRLRLGLVAQRGAQRPEAGQGLRPDPLASLEGFDCAEKGRARW